MSKPLLMCGTIKCASSSNGQECGFTVGDTLDELHTMLGEETFPLKWEGTTMNDGKPLLMSIHENEGRALG